MRKRESPTNDLRFRHGVPEDAGELAGLHTTVADHFTSLYGEGPWLVHTSEKGALHAMRHSGIFVATEGPVIVATFRLATKEPWAIETSAFKQCERPVYLLS